MKANQAKQRQEFIEALLKVAEMAKTVPHSELDVPPMFIAAQCDYWVERYQKYQAAVA